jgi:hypothetical protein
VWNYKEKTVNMKKNVRGLYLVHLVCRCIAHTIRCANNKWRYFYITQRDALNVLSIDILLPHVASLAGAAERLKKACDGN